MGSISKNPVQLHESSALKPNGFVWVRFCFAGALGPAISIRTLAASGCRQRSPGRTRRGGPAERASGGAEGAMVANLKGHDDSAIACFCQGIFRGFLCRLELRTKSGTRGMPCGSGPRVV
jgi:hypothetical protein